MADKTDTQRMTDMRAMLKKARPKDRITLAELAALWGTSKQRFVTLRPTFVGFPDPVEKIGNAFLYEVKPCVQALLEHLERHKQVSVQKSQRIAALTGINQMDADQQGNLSIAEIAKANQIGASIEERERDQGLYAPLADVQRDVGQIFSLMSEFYSTAANRLDPHGRLLSPEMRQSLEKNAHDALLECHAILKAWLSSDVDGIPTRRAPARSRKPQARRKPASRAPRKAR